jgi:hypothetical protein
VAGSLGAVLLTNLMAGGTRADTLEVTIPPELWLAAGISGGTLATSKVKLKIPDGAIAAKADPGDARWIDMVRSDVGAGADAIDLSKLQMFLFSEILVAGYGAAVANELLNVAGTVEALPALNSAFVTPLLISNGTYLARKSAHLIPNQT